jgi:hypothetical protein
MIQFEDLVGEVGFADLFPQEPTPPPPGHEKHLSSWLSLHKVLGKASRDDVLNWLTYECNHGHRIQILNRLLARLHKLEAHRIIRIYGTY